LEDGTGLMESDFFKQIVSCYMLCLNGIAMWYLLNHFYKIFVLSTRQGILKASVESMGLKKNTKELFGRHWKICRFSEFYHVCFTNNIECSWKSFCFCVTVPKIQPAPRPAPNRNQGVPTQRGDAGKVEELNTQVRSSGRMALFFVLYI